MRSLGTELCAYNFFLYDNFSYNSGKVYYLHNNSKTCSLEIQNVTDLYKKNEDEYFLAITASMTEEDYDLLLKFYLFDEMRDKSIFVVLYNQSNNTRNFYLKNMLTKFIETVTLQENEKEGMLKVN